MKRERELCCIYISKKKKKKKNSERKIFFMQPQSVSVWVSWFWFFNLIVDWSRAILVENKRDRDIKIHMITTRDCTAFIYWLVCCISFYIFLIKPIEYHSRSLEYFFFIWNTGFRCERADKRKSIKRLMRAAWYHPISSLATSCPSLCHFPFRVFFSIDRLLISFAFFILIVYNR
jgi:hypothetical protein